MNKRAILQLTLEGEYVQTFESTKMAARSVQGEGAAISHAAIKNKSYKGFLWQYAEPKPQRRSKIEILEEWNINLLQDLEDRIDELEDFYVTSKIHQIIYNNDCINELLMQEEPIEKKTRHGRPPIVVDMYNKDGQFLKRFESIKQASEETGDSVVAIRATLNGKLDLTAHGFYFKKVDETKTKQKETQEEDEETIDENFFYIPRSKENRKNMLKNYIESRLGTYMMHLTKHQQILERKFLQTIIKSL